MALVVYTVWTGRYEDEVRPPWCAPVPGVSFRCFTDDATLAVPGWDMIVVAREDNPIRQARRLKILAQHTVPDASISLWLDASFELIVDPRAIVERWMPTGGLLPPVPLIVALPHPDRQTYVQEGDEVTRLGLAPKVAIDQQVARYQSNGFDPAQQRRITSTGFLLRQHTPQMAAFNTHWWKEFSYAGHTRDQMSVDYVLWREQLSPTYLAGHYRENPYARYYRPNRRQQARVLPAKEPVDVFADR